MEKGKVGEIIAGNPTKIGYTAGWEWGGEHEGKSFSGLWMEEFTGGKKENKGSSFTSRSNIRFV